MGLADERDATVPGVSMLQQVARSVAGPEGPGLGHPRLRVSLRILFVAYPMLPVTESVAGGAEQMLWTVEHEMAARGFQTAVAGCKDSRAAGAVVDTGAAPSILDAFDHRKAEHEAGV